MDEQLEETYSQRKGQGKFSVKIRTVTNDILRVNQPIVLIQLKNHHLSDKVYHPFGLNYSSLSTNTVLKLTPG